MKKWNELKKKFNRMKCKLRGHHIAGTSYIYDAITTTCKCKCCGQMIRKDLTGDWYEI